MRRAVVLLLGGLVLLGGTAWAAPNDPGWYQQWNLSKIRADKAWGVSKGSGVVVAIVDTGIDLAHPDFKGRLVGGVNLVGGGSPQDDNGHGTFMAGIVAAATGNGEGVASIAPSAKLMPVKVLDDQGIGKPETVADGIRWAVDHGADVINLSLAETSSGGIQLPTNFFSNSDLDDAIREAAAAGRFVAVAAGNVYSSSGGEAETSYDATVSGVLVVGASTSGDKRAAYSNYGSGLDVLAPGGGSATNATHPACHPNDPVTSTWWDNGSRYGAGCGTSMSVAHVSGIAALLKARGYSAASAAGRIRSTAKDLGANGWDSQTGYGRVDAAAAVGASSSAAPAPSAPKPVKKKAIPPKKVAAAASPGTAPSVAPAKTTTPTPTTSPTGLLLAVDETSGTPPTPRRPLVLVATAMAMLVGVAHPLVRVTMRPR